MTPSNQAAGAAVLSRPVEGGGGESPGASNEVISFDPDIAPRRRDNGEAISPTAALSPGIICRS